MNDKTNKILPFGLRIAALYLMIAGVAGIVWLLLSLGPNHPEFVTLSAASRAGAYVRDGMIHVAFLVCGGGLFMRKTWARKGALIALIAATIYGGNAFAWGVAGGPPSAHATFIGYGVMASWNAIWFYLICRSQSAGALR